MPTKIELETELDDLYGVLESIYDECDAGDPDIETIKSLAGGALDIENSGDRDELED
jgi:hypothetical protein